MAPNADGVCIDSVLYMHYISTGMERVQDESHYRIFPNPAKDLIKLFFSTPNDNRKIVISDILGNIIVESKISFLENEINISEVVQGIYLVSIIEDNKVFTEQIIIDK